MLEEHRRCEMSIAQFSNRYVYDNRMIIHKEDKVKPFLESNLCFFDIRGIKSSRHINLSEVKAVVTLIKMLLSYYKKEDIAVIAPYKNQVLAIREALGDSSVQVGTIHTFQGKDKEIVIVSTTLSSEKDEFAKKFIGSKPNMLNVAFTRAKQQLVIIGNYSVLEHCEHTNYLYKVSEHIRSAGALFSLYRSDTMDTLSDYQINTFHTFIASLNDKPTPIFKKIFGPYLNEVGLIEDEQHYKLLMNLFNDYCLSVTIICPWITTSVVKENFIEGVKKFKANDKTCHIVFGYNMSKDTLSTNEEIKSIIKRDHQFIREKDLEYECNQILRLKNIMGKNLIYRPPLHTKILIVNNEFLLVGSHNWLSKQGQRKGSRKEMTAILQDKDAVKYILGKYDIH